MIRGPGIIPGEKTDAVALAIDFAPTILDMAGIEIPEYMDGRSLLGLLLVRKDVPQQVTKIQVSKISTTFRMISQRSLPTGNS